MYYIYDDMGRAYKSDFYLMGTAGADLTQAYDELDGSLENF